MKQKLEIDEKLTAGGSPYRAYITIPDFGKFWICFDLSNGHKGGRGYAWIFRTKKEAIEHRKYQHKKKSGAKLSFPFKIQL